MSLIACCNGEECMRCHTYAEAVWWRQPNLLLRCLEEDTEMYKRGKTRVLVSNIKSSKTSRDLH